MEHGVVVCRLFGERVERGRKNVEVKDDRTISVEIVKDEIVVSSGGTKEREA